MSARLLAHALPQSVGAVPLTLVLTGLIAAFLVVNAVGTRRASRRVDNPSVPRHDRDGLHTDASGDAMAATGVAATGGLVIGWALLVITLLLAILGPTDPATNLTDVAVLTLGWGAVALTSLVVGGWWPVVDPVSAVSRTLEGSAGPTTSRPLPDGVATAGMAALMVGWSASQLLLKPTNLTFTVLLLTYLVINVVLAGVYGPAWLRRAESVTVMSRTLGLLRPGGGGPLQRLSVITDSPHLRLVSATLIGWSLTDLVLETEWWHDLALSTGPVSFLLLILTVATLYGVIHGASARAGLGPAFVAVAAGWVVSHYLSILLIEGQGIPIWLSDPFGTGADLLGRRGDLIDLEPLAVGLLTTLQIVPFLAGHVLGVVVAQRRAAARVSAASQIGPVTFFARAVIAVLLLGGTYLQLAGL